MSILSEMFFIVSLSCFACFLEPVLSVWSLNPKFMPNGVAGWATPPSILSVVILWKFVAIFTMCFPKINGGWPISSKYVVSLASKFKMVWVTARRIITFMIELAESCFLNSSWNGMYKKSVKYSMYSLRSFSVPYKAISTKIKGTVPQPAFSLWINRYFRKNSISLLFSEVNYKVFNHASLYHTMRGLSIWQK